MYGINLGLFKMLAAGLMKVGKRVEGIGRKFT